MSLITMANLLTSPMQAIAVAGLLVTGTYLYSKLYYRRFKQNAHIPQLPSSLLWGHLLVFDEFTKRGIPDRHPGESSFHGTMAITACLLTVRNYRYHIR